MKAQKFQLSKNFTYLAMIFNSTVIEICEDKLWISCGFQLFKSANI